MEVQGLKVTHRDSPLNIARDLTVIFILLVVLVDKVVNNVAHSLDAVREGEKKFRKVFQVSPVAISISTLADGRLVDANDAFFVLTGYERQSAIGGSVLEFGLWADELERQLFNNRLLEQKSLQNPAFKFVSFTGQERIALAFYELIELENRPAVLSMFYDVTEQKSTQLALQASEKKYRNFVEQSIEGIWFLAFDAALQSGREKVETPDDGASWVQQPFPYQARCLQWLASYARLDADDRLSVNALLRGTGAESLFA